MTRYDKDAPINIWVGNLGKYNEGELVGEWFSLPCDDFDDEWEELMKRIGIGGRYEEVFCADWECSIPGLTYSEYPDYEELNEIADEWERLDDTEQAIVSIRMDMLDEGFFDAISKTDDVCIYYGCQDMTDVAIRYIDETGMLDQSSTLSSYFDYEMFGRDMSYEGCFEYSDELGCMVEIIY